MWCVLGHVGVPLPCNYVKLEDVADMDYFSANNEGEVGTGRHVQTIMVGMFVTERTHNCEQAWV